MQSGHLTLFPILPTANVIFILDNVLMIPGMVIILCLHIFDNSQGKLFCMNLTFENKI